MAYLAIITDRETKEENHVYLFNYLELLALLPKLNPDVYEIEITEANGVYDLSSFLNSAKDLVPDDYWVDFEDKLDEYLDDNEFNSN